MLAIQNSGIVIRPQLSHSTMQIQVYIIADTPERLIPKIHKTRGGRLNYKSCSYSLSDILLIYVFSSVDQVLLVEGAVITAYFSLC